MQLSRSTQECNSGTYPALRRFPIMNLSLPPRQTRIECWQIRMFGVFGCMPGEIPVLRPRRGLRSSGQTIASQAPVFGLGMSLPNQPPAIDNIAFANATLPKRGGARELAQRLRVDMHAPMSTGRQGGSLGYLPHGSDISTGLLNTSIKLQTQNRCL